MNNKKQILAAILLIVIIGAVVYSNTFDNSFVFDDHAFIVHKSSLHDLTSPEGWGEFYRGQSPQRLIGFLSFALNYHFHKLDVFGYHLVNLCIHLMNAFLIWKLLTFILSLPKFKETGFAENKEIIAIFGALIFLTHPVQTQAVTYIYQRLASLMALFYLLSMNLYLEARSLRGNKRKSFMLFLGSAIAALCAMLTKENSFTLPLAIVLSEVFFMGKGTEGKKEGSRYVKIARFAPLLFLLILPLLFSFNVQGVLHSQYFRGQENTVITSQIYLLTEFRVIVTYIRLLFIPINQNLDYDYPIYYNLFEPAVLMSLLFLLSILFFTFKLIRKSPLVSFGIFWFFLALSVESSIIPIRYVIFEHRLYLPMAGFAIAFSAGLYNLIKNPKHYKACAMAIIVIFSALTYQRNNVWQEPFTMWRDVVRKSPNKPYVQFAMGRAYNSKGQYHEAIENFQKAIFLYRQKGPVIDAGLLSQIYNSLGIAYYYTYEDKKAVQCLQKAIEYRPRSTSLMENLGKMYYEFNRYNDAVDIFNQALDIQPSANMYYYRGLSFQKLNKRQEAEADLKQAKTLYQQGGSEKEVEEINNFFNSLK